LWKFLGNGGKWDDPEDPTPSSPQKSDEKLKSSPKNVTKYKTTIHDFLISYFSLFAAFHPKCKNYVLFKQCLLLFHFFHVLKLQ
jgi:hypothetical protein